jgi:predicted  nucleic acid-binding Zn-ribbon protein
MCESGIKVLKDTNPNVLVHIQSIMAEMKKEKYINRKLEAARDKRKEPEIVYDGTKKKVTVKDVMSEQQMFQEEHLKLQREHHQLKKHCLSLEKRLEHLEGRMAEHLDDFAFATRVESTISSLGVTQTPEVTDMTIERCTCCLLPVTDCKCFD